MRSGKTLRWCGALALALLSSQPAEASFHLMQIEQVIGGVCGDVNSQAIQLRMRVSGQNVVTGVKLVAYDAQGLNPVVVFVFPRDVSVGARILITTPQFPISLSPSITPDFIMTNPIPASYMAAGRLTYEDNFIIWWSLAWGGAGYTGPNNGSLSNDDDGDFGPPFADPLPSSTGQALLFQGLAGDQSSNNADDYALTAGVFTNNAGASGTVMPDCIFGDGFESGNISAWSGSGGGGLEVLSGAASSGNFGLAVTAGLTCSPNDLTVTSPPTISGVFEGCNSVTASGVQVVSPGATFRAGTFIALGEAFSVASGADFSAVIDPFLLSPFAWVQDDSPIAETIYNAIFQLRLDALSLAVGDELEHFVGYSSNGDPQFRVVLRKDPTLLENRLAILAREDGGAFVEHSLEFLLPAGYNRIEIAWRAGAGDGEFLVSINSAPLSGLTGLNNGGSQIDFVQWGAVDGTVASTTGPMELDEFLSFR